MGFPLYVILFLPLAAFNSLSLSLIFPILITMCLAVVFLGSLVGRSVELHGLRDYLLPQIGEVFSNYLLKDTFYPFFSLFFWYLYITNIVLFGLVTQFS